MNLLHTFQRLRAADQRRNGLPGEHWATLGSGLTLLMRARRQRSGLGRTLALLAGGAMLVRAASGRDGLGRWLNPPQPGSAPAEPRDARQTTPTAGSIATRLSGDGLGTEPRPGIDRLGLHTSQGLAGAQGSGGAPERAIY